MFIRLNNSPDRHDRNAAVRAGSATAIMCQVLAIKWLRAILYARRGSPHVVVCRTDPAWFNSSRDQVTLGGLAVYVGVPPSGGPFRAHLAGRSRSVLRCTLESRLQAVLSALIWLEGPGASSGVRWSPAFRRSFPRSSCWTVQVRPPGVRWSPALRRSFPPLILLDGPGASSVYVGVPP